MQDTNLFRFFFSLIFDYSLILMYEFSSHPKREIGDISNFNICFIFLNYFNTVFVDSW